MLGWLSWEHALQGYRFCRVHVHLCDQLIQLAFALRNKLMKKLSFWQSGQHLNSQKRNLKIPTFWSSSQMSPRLLSFLQRTLVRDPAQRASAFELLNHAFILSTTNSSSLADMMKSFRHSVC